ncbi:hypothetical protein ACFL1Z_02200 [Thermodesulfobacteriota bacterium]
MSRETKIIKGGFRATLALIVSIISLIIAIIAYNRTGDQAALSTQISDLQSKMKTLKMETSEKVNMVRQETNKLLKNVGVEIKKEEGGKKEVKAEETKP